MAWVYFGLTSHVKPSQFERVVQALIFTVAIQAIVVIERIIAEFVGQQWFSLGEWTSESNLIVSLATAVVFGIGVSALTNVDGFHALARKLKLSTRSGHPGEWHAAFCDHVCYVVLHLKDGTRLYGWPSRWPSESSNGHFFIKDVTRQANGETQLLTEIEGILIDVKDVASVEFVKKPETTHDQAANAATP